MSASIIRNSDRARRSKQASLRGFNRTPSHAKALRPTTPPLSFLELSAEDITYSLLHECQLKVQVGLSAEEPSNDDERANHVTLILANAINAEFGDTRVNVLPALGHWRSRFVAVPFSRCEDGPFPAIRMLKDCHVAAIQYYHVAMCMGMPELCTSSAVEICELAMSAKSDPVVVNAYGPISFTAKWLIEGMQRQALVAWLRNTQTKTAWPVEGLISKLQKSWGDGQTTDLWFRSQSLNRDCSLCQPSIAKSYQIA